MENRYRILNIVGSGNTQREGQRHGAECLYFKLRKFSLPDTFVGLRAWDANTKELAAHIAFGRTFVPIINLFTYSWGSGEFAKSLCEDLHQHGLTVANIVAADPVYRSHLAEYIPGLGHLARAIGVARRGHIQLPPNVLRVQSFVQSNTIPMGGRFLAGSPHTMIEPAIDLTAKGYGHNEMDEAIEWHEAALAVARQYA